MNILYLINHAGKGGSEKYVEILSEKIGKIKDNKVFLAYNEEGMLVSNVQKNGIETVQIKMKSPFDFKAVKEISDFCIKNKIDVIHTQFARENYLALFVKMKLKNIKVIFTSHINIENNFLWKIMNKIMIKNNDYVISVCNKNKDMLIKNGYPKEKIKIILNGTEYFDTKYNHKDSKIRDEFFVDKETFLFVTVSRMSLEKGISFLIDSIAKFSEITKLDYKFLLVGDGDEIEKIKDKAKLLGVEDNIIFAGYRTDVDKILEGVDCFVNSSKSEALSFAILEALSKGVPIIATKVGGNPDIINDETNCGILVRYGSDVAMARAMEKMVSDKKYYSKCSDNAYIAIKEKFNIEDVVKKTYELY